MPAAHLCWAGDSTEFASRARSCQVLQCEKALCFEGVLKCGLDAFHRSIRQENGEDAG